MSSQRGLKGNSPSSHTATAFMPYRVWGFIIQDCILVQGASALIKNISEIADFYCDLMCFIKFYPFSVRSENVRSYVCLKTCLVYWYVKPVCTKSLCLTFLNRGRKLCYYREKLKINNCHLSRGYRFWKLMFFRALVKLLSSYFYFWTDVTS